MTDSLDPVVRAVTVGVSQRSAFETWTNRIDLWWPVERISASREESSRVIMEAGEGGRLFERVASGDEYVWGRVVAWEPPSRIVVRWFLDADPDRATTIEVRFEELAARSTRVIVTHGDWDNAAEEVAHEHRSCVAADEGWTGILLSFQRAAAVRP